MQSTSRPVASLTLSAGEPAGRDRAARPSSAFLLYRTLIAAELVDSSRSSMNQLSLSREAALRWREEPEDVRLLFETLAHADDMPSYRFRPVSRWRSQRAARRTARARQTLPSASGGIRVDEEKLMDMQPSPYGLYSQLHKGKLPERVVALFMSDL